MVFSITYYFKLHDATFLFTQRIILLPTKSHFCYIIFIQTYLIFVDAQWNLLLEVIRLRNPKYGVTLNIINNVVVSFGCNSTLSFKILQLPVVLPIKPQFVQLSLNQYGTFPSLKVSTCPASNV